MGKSKYTKQMLVALLTEHGATLISDTPDFIPDKFRIKFKCKCGKLNEKQRKHITKDKCYCKDCQNDIKSKKISNARKRKLEPITNEKTQKRCSECKGVANKSEFFHDQSPTKDVITCQTCRDKKKLKDAKRRKNFKENPPISENENEVFCPSCFVKRHKDEFKEGNKTCNICRATGNRLNKKYQDDVKKFNEENEDFKKCCRCYQVYEKNVFITEYEEKLGVLCEDCRLYIFTRQEDQRQMYVNLKIQAGPCVDCGLEDIRLLEFDHKDPSEKEYCVGRARSIPKLIEEVEKCEHRCIKCHRLRSQKQFGYGDYERPGQRYLNQLKLDIGKCESCEWFDENSLFLFDFDHKDQNEKLYNVSYMAANAMSLEEIEKEVKKCRLLCAHCHKLHTIDQLGYKLYENLYTYNVIELKNLKTLNVNK